MVERQKCLEDETRPRERLKMEAQVRVSQRRSDVGHACDWLGRRGRRQKNDTASASKGRSECRSHEASQGKPRDLDPMVLEPSANTEGIELVTCTETTGGLEGQMRGGTHLPGAQQQS